MTGQRRAELADLTLFATPSDPTISPDGTRVVYTLRTTDDDENVEQLWLAGESLPPRRLTRGSADGAARFSPDGTRLAFLRGTGANRQLWLLSFDGAEPEQLTALPLGAGTPVWSPDGARLALSAPVDAAAHHGRHDAEPIVIDRPRYKLDGVGRLGSVRNQLFVLDLTDRTIRQLTDGDAGAGTPAWSPEGDRLGYAEQPDARGGSSAFVVDPADGTASRVGPPGGVVADVSFSSEGMLLTCAPDTGVRNLRLAGVSPETGEPRYLAVDLDRNIMPGAPGYAGARAQESSDGRTLLFCARDRGATHLYAMADGKWRKLVDGERSISGLAVARDAPLAAAVISTVDSAGEVALLENGTGRITTLTAHTANALGDVAIVAPRERTFAVSGARTVHGWLIRRPDLDGPGPLLVDIHGGPHNAWNPVRDPAHHYHQVLAARGWTVLLLNIRGSDGYGEAFLRDSVGAWGESDERDVLDPIDALVDEGIADADRLALCGYSYGGYLACWLSTRTDRFAAVVAGGAICDLDSFAGTSDVGIELLATELGATVGDQQDRVARLSPISHLATVTSPTLILHGDADERCPVGQAEQWFAGLRASGVPTELVLYPGASHTFILDGRPSQRADYNRRIVDWVVRHTRAAARIRDASTVVPLRQEHWQRRLHTLATEHGVVGASLAIHCGGQTAEATTGVLNRRTGTPVTPDALFQLGSITKVYTATAALRLVDDGVLELDAPLADVLPTRVAPHTPITLRHLLTHTSGLDGDLFTDTGRGDDCVERFVAELAGTALLHPVGATWSYCNSGFVVVGRLIERATGLSWDDAMRQLVFDPLGLTETVTLPEEVLCHAAAHGHLRGADGTLEPAPRWGIPRSSGPAGLIVASARDALEFARAHLRGGTSAAGARVVDERTAEQMRTEQVVLPQGTGMADAWGLGWFLQHWHGHTVVGHDGGTIGQGAMLRLFPEHDLAVSLLTNGGPVRDLADALCREIAVELAGVEQPEPERPPVPPPDVDTSDVPGTYELAGLRLDVFEAGGRLVLRTTPTGAFAELGAEAEQELELTATAQGRFLTRLPGEHRWTPVTCYRLADGGRYLHFAGRAAPRTDR